MSTREALLVVFVRTRPYRTKAKISISPPDSTQKNSTDHIVVL